jgi:hypothetical protein
MHVVARSFVRWHGYQYSHVTSVPTIERSAQGQVYRESVLWMPSMSSENRACIGNTLLSRGVESR